MSTTAAKPNLYSVPAWVAPLAGLLLASLIQRPLYAGPDTIPETPNHLSSEDVQDVAVRGLSWDLLAGGVPDSGALVEAALGFSGLPRVAYHYTVAPDISIGAMVSFDYAYWLPKAAFEPSLLLQAPVRYSLFHSPTLSVGLRADPGLGFFFPGNGRSSFALGVLINGSANVGFTVQNRFIIGGGLDIPLAFLVGAKGSTDVALPLLFGPLFEYHVIPPLALTVNLRIGPHINSNDIGTNFAFSMMAGIAYRL